LLFHLKITVAGTSIRYPWNAFSKAVIEIRARVLIVSSSNPSHLPFLSMVIARLGGLPGASPAGFLDLCNVSRYLDQVTTDPGTHLSFDEMRHASPLTEQ
jgi:hypothetical protein